MSCERRSYLVNDSWMCLLLHHVKDLSTQGQKSWENASPHNSWQMVEKLADRSCPSGKDHLRSLAEEIRVSSLLEPRCVLGTSPFRFRKTGLQRSRNIRGPQVYRVCSFGISGCAIRPYVQRNNDRPQVRVEIPGMDAGNQLGEQVPHAGRNFHQ